MIDKHPPGESGIRLALVFITGCHGCPGLLAGVPGDNGVFTIHPQSMQSFADAYPEEQIMQQGVAQIPWGHPSHNSNWI